MERSWPLGDLFIASLLESSSHSPLSDSFCSFALYVILSFFTIGKFENDSEMRSLTVARIVSLTHSLT